MGGGWYTELWRMTGQADINLEIRREKIWIARFYPKEKLQQDSLHRLDLEPTGQLENGKA